MLRWVFGLVALFLLSSPASAWWNQYVPECSDGEVLSRISERATWAENHTWQRGWTIHSIGKTYQTSYKDHPSHIDRRYCRGTAWLTNGRASEIVYVIEAGQGFAGIGWRVEFCLPSYDPWRVYDGWCRSIRY